MLKRKILLAEDDEDDQHFFINFLQSRNDITLMPVVENGIALVELLEKINTDEELPDYIILDQNMPKRNGLQTLQILKTKSRYAHIPVMIYSTYTDDQLIQKGTALGACMVMTKPLTKEGYDQLVNAFFMERN